MPYKFFLGGYDAEMIRIREVLEVYRIPFEDAHLNWGAKASVYGEKILDIAKDGVFAVLVELVVDVDVPEGTIVIDHHGDRSGEPASILQVLNLLDQEPSRWDLLIAANDAGWFPALIAISATSGEVERVRSADRSAQGITLEQEREADRALAASAEWIGNIRLVRMAHSKKACVDDRFYLEAIKRGEPLLEFVILSGDGEVNYQGRGSRAKALDQKFPGGWVGGAGLETDGTAYWGGYPDHAQVEEFFHQLVV